MITFPGSSFSLTRFMSECKSWSWSDLHAKWKLSKPGTVVDITKLISESISVRMRVPQEDNLAPIQIEENTVQQILLQEKSATANWSTHGHVDDDRLLSEFLGLEKTRRAA
ncbi:hypothetical protein MKW92_026906 [Papaver armeniacum]|nr:hypothetical protein MKW92_026906 [Papaver armeniacum]